MKNKLAGNLGLKLIALIAAFLIWMVVTNSNNPRKTILLSNVPITVVNQDSIADIGKVVELDGNGTVTLKVTERRSILDRLSKNGSDFYVEADIENINAMNTVPLTVTCSNSNITWDEIDISPSSLKVTLEDKVEQPFVVSVSPSGSTGANGYEVGTTEVKQGKNIYIAGPESVMKIINQVVAPIDINGVSSDMTLTSTLKIIDKNGSELKDSQLSTLEFKDSNGAVITDRTVQVDVTMWKVQTDIPIQVETTGTPAFGYRVAGISTVPVTISLAGTQEALAELDGKFKLTDKISVAGAAENISQDIDITDMLADMPGLKLITDADPNITIQVQIEKTGDAQLSIPLASIEMQNRPADMNLVFTPADKVAISIHTDSGDASGIQLTDIKASVDLTACETEGNYTLPLTVELPDGYELASEVTIKVNAVKQTVEEPETETE